MGQVEGNNKSIDFYKGLVEIDQEDIDYLIKLNIKLPNGNIIKIDMIEPLDINYETIEKDLEVISRQFSFWCAVYSELKFMVETKEVIFKNIKSKNATKLIEGGITKKTDLDLYINSLDSTKESELDLLKDKRLLDKMKNFLKAVEMKFEALRSLAGFKRQDYNNSR